MPLLKSLGTGLKRFGMVAALPTAHTIAKVIPKMVSHSAYVFCVRENFFFYDFGRIKIPDLYIELWLALFELSSSLTNKIGLTVVWLGCN